MVLQASHWWSLFLLYHLRNLSFQISPVSTLYPSQICMLFSMRWPIFTTISAFFACGYLLLECLFSSSEPVLFPYKLGLPFHSSKKKPSHQFYHILIAHLSCTWCCYFCGFGVHVQCKVWILNIWNLFFKSVETLTVNHKLLKGRDFVFYLSCMFFLGGPGTELIGSFLLSQS